MYGMYHGGSELLGLGVLSVFTILPLVVWTIVWKGWALWLAARRGELWWFIALLVLNTMGLLEIFYIFAIAKRQETKEEPTVVVSEEDK